MLGKFLSIGLFSVFFLLLSVDGSFANDVTVLNKVMNESIDQVLKAMAAVKEAPNDNRKNVEERVKLLEGVYEVAKKQLESNQRSTLEMSLLLNKTATKYPCIMTAGDDAISQLDTTANKFLNKTHKLEEGNSRNLKLDERMLGLVESFLRDYEALRTKESINQPEKAGIIVEEATAIAKHISETVNVVMANLEKEKFKYFEAIVHYIYEAEISYKRTSSNGVKNISKCLA